jgi:hypothetical protein
MSPLQSAWYVAAPAQTIGYSSGEITMAPPFWVMCPIIAAPYDFPAF